MAINMIRVDDRLIHGQIVAAWVKSLGLERIWIVDDATANDSFLKNVMKMVAPPGILYALLRLTAVQAAGKWFSLNTMCTCVPHM